MLAMASSISSARAESDLPELLRDYFRAPSAARMKAAEKEIINRKGLTHEQLARAIGEVNLWDNREPGDYEMTLRLRKGKSSEKSVFVHVPKGYTPEKAWPLLIAFHGQGARPEPMLKGTLIALGDLKDEFIVVAPDRIGAIEPAEGEPAEYHGALAFTYPHAVVGQPRMLLDAIRREFRIDSDRVYLMGFSLGSHNAWMAGIMHADCFAGLMPLATPLQVVGNDLLYESLLSNLRDVPIVYCWGEKDNLDSAGKPEPSGGNVGISRTLSMVIKALGFPDYTAVELAGAGHLDVVPPPEEFYKLLKKTRRRYPKRVHQIFRLPEESSAYWVSTDHLQGEPLPHGPLQIPQSPDEDPRTATRRFLLGKLGLIEATCKKQTITIRSKNAVRITLLLGDELIDLDKPIKIKRGRKTVFDGRIERDLRVMLREAASGWDFNRLPSARVVIPIAGDIKFGYGDEPKKSSGRKRK